MGLPTCVTISLRINLTIYLIKFPAVIEWVRIHPMDAGCLTGRAVVAGGEGHDGTPLWVIRAHYRGDLIPGKLAILHHAAFVPFGGQEHTVDDIEVFFG